MTILKTNHSSAKDIEIYRYVIFDKSSGGVLMNIVVGESEDGFITRIHMKCACCPKTFSIAYGGEANGTLSARVRSECERPIAVETGGRIKLTAFGKTLRRSASSTQLGEGAWLYASDGLIVEHLLPILQHALWQLAANDNDARGHDLSFIPTIH
jgi:hypothetical protein